MRILEEENRKNDHNLMGLWVGLGVAGSLIFIASMAAIFSPVDAISNKELDALTKLSTAED